MKPRSTISVPVNQSPLLTLVSSIALPVLLLAVKWLLSIWPVKIWSSAKKSSPSPPTSPKPATDTPPSSPDSDSALTAAAAVDACDSCSLASSGDQTPSSTVKKRARTMRRVANWLADCRGKESLGSSLKSGALVSLLVRAGSLNSSLKLNGCDWVVNGKQYWVLLLKC